MSTSATDAVAPAVDATPSQTPAIVAVTTPDAAAAATQTSAAVPPAVEATATEATVPPSSTTAGPVPLTRRRARELSQAPLAVSPPLVVSPPPAAEPAVELVEVAPTLESDVEDTAEFELMEFDDAPADGEAADQPDRVDEPMGLLIAEPAADAAPTASDDDEPAASDDPFEAAARLFSFTGETPVQAAAPAPEPAEEHAAPLGAARARRARMTGASFKRMATASISVTAIGIVGLITVGMTTPAQAVAAAGSVSVAAGAVSTQSGLDSDSDDIQAYVAPDSVQNVGVQRAENYSTGTLVELAGTTGITNASSAVFTNNPSCAVQWPFAVGTTISYGFGQRPGEFHEGVDFTPGDGAHIQAIADGTVRVSTDSGGGYGVMIIIDHIIDGQLVSTRYGHMQYGSRQVQTGDHVTVGEYIGRTGNTGRSYGAHTHVEVLQNGTTPIDPLPWLRAHATC